VSDNLRITQDMMMGNSDLLLVGTVRSNVIQLVGDLWRFFPSPCQDLLNATSDRSTLQPTRCRVTSRHCVNTLATQLTNDTVLLCHCV